MEPKFKVGDLIWKNHKEDTINRIFKIESDHYCLGNCADLPFTEQDEWELLEYHFAGIGKPRKATGVLAKFFEKMEIEKTIVDKACVWLEDNIPNYWSQINANETKEFIEKFRNYLEG